MYAITGLFYGCRGIFQVFCVMEKPEGYLWDYPGFFAFTVGYG